MSDVARHTELESHGRPHWKRAAFGLNGNALLETGGAAVGDRLNVTLHITAAWHDRRAPAR
jgi:hypothetical protein